jgi:hypothetical protein
MGDEKEKNNHVLGIEDKRQIIIVVSSSTNGNFLPLQIIYLESTMRCLLPNTTGKVSCLIASFHLMYSINHWSTLETCQQSLERILIPYMKSQMHELNLLENQKMIWFIDC